MNEKNKKRLIHPKFLISMQLSKDKQIIVPRLVNSESSKSFRKKTVIEKVLNINTKEDKKDRKLKLVLSK